MCVCLLPKWWCPQRLLPGSPIGSQYATGSLALLIIPQSEYLNSSFMMIDIVYYYYEKKMKNLTITGDKPSNIYMYIFVNFAELTEIVLCSIPR